MAYGSHIPPAAAPALPPLEIGTFIEHFQKRPVSLQLLCGHSGVYALSLLIGSADGSPLIVIDGTTRFNSYLLSRIAVQLHCSPREILRRTYVTRSFTAYQTEAAVTVKLPRFLQSRPLCRNILILGLLHTYYDDQVKPAECRQSLVRVLQKLRQFARNGRRVLIADVQVDAAPQGKENLFRIVRQHVECTTMLTSGGEHLQLQEIPSWDETTKLSR